MVFGVFLTQKSTDSVSFSTTFGGVFSVFTQQIHSFFGYSPPVSVGGGVEISQICGVFSSKILKMHIFDLFERLHPPNNFKKQKTSPWGFAPNPTLTCEAAGAGGKPYPPTPTVSVGSIQGVKGKMHDFVALDPSPSPWGSKTNRSGRSWKPVKACEATA